MNECMCLAYDADSDESGLWRPCPSSLCERVDHDHYEGGGMNGQSIAEMRAMADEALLNGGHGKHDDPAYYSRNLAILLRQTLDHIEAVERLRDWGG